MTSFSPLWWVLLSSALSAFFVVALIAPARRFDLVDHPAGRKNHAVPTPLVGGGAVFLSLALTEWFAPGTERQPDVCVGHYDGYRCGR